MSESVADHFAEQAERQPDAPALFWDGRTISYGELREMADRAHAELEALGLPPDRPVGIQARKSPEAIALILACLKARRRCCSGCTAAATASGPGCPACRGR